MGMSNVNVWTVNNALHIFCFKYLVHASCPQRLSQTRKARGKAPPEGDRTTLIQPSPIAPLISFFIISTFCDDIGQFERARSLVGS